VFPVFAEVREDDRSLRFDLGPRTGDKEGLKVYRKSATDTSWGESIAEFGEETIEFVDSTLEVGRPYEYRFFAESDIYSGALTEGYNYVYGGIGVPAVEQRGGCSSWSTLHLPRKPHPSLLDFVTIWSGMLGR